MIKDFTKNNNINNNKVLKHVSKDVIIWQICAFVAIFHLILHHMNVLQTFGHVK